MLPPMTSVRLLTDIALANGYHADWYAHATRDLRTLADREGFDFDTLCDVVAITSPRVPVTRNIRLAVAVMRGETPNGLMRGVVAALDHYWETGEIRGPKTGPFAEALRGDPDAIVLDVWMARAFGIDQRKLSNVGVRHKAAARVGAVAQAIGWSNAETQAAIWAGAYRAGRGRSAPFFPVLNAATPPPRLFAA